MARFLEAIRRLTLLVRFVLFLAVLAAASRQGPGRHRRSTVQPYMEADWAFLAELRDLFAAAGAGSLVTA